MISQQLLRQAASTGYMSRELSWGNTLYVNCHFPAILGFKLLRQGRENNCEIPDWLRESIDELVEKDYPVTEGARETLRLQYTGDLCDAINNSRSPNEIRSFATSYRNPLLILEGVSKRQSRIFAAAAGGDNQALLNTIHSVDDVLKRPNKHFPSALEASVTMNQFETVEFILEWTFKRVKGPHETGDRNESERNERRSSAFALCSALRRAMKLRRCAIREAIFGTLCRQGPLDKSLAPKAAKSLLLDSITDENPRILCQTSHYLQHGQWSHHDELPALGQRTILTIFQECSTTQLRQLLHMGMFDVNNSSVGRSLFWCAIKTRRYDLAMVLLENGAHVDLQCLHDGRMDTAVSRIFRSRMDTTVSRIFRTGSVEFLQQIIEDSKGRFSVENLGLRYRPLWLALEAGRHDLAIWLLKQGADVDGHSIHKGQAMTVAQRASSVGREGDVEFLVEKWGAKETVAKRKKGKKGGRQT